MLEHQSEEIPETEYVHHQPAPVSESAPKRELNEQIVDYLDQVSESAPHAESREQIEDYLDQVVAPLVGVLPRSKREAIRGNVRGKLDSIIAAHRELGESEEVAITTALRQYGEPGLLSQRWYNETCAQTSRQVQRQGIRLNQTMVSQPSACAATLTALGLFGLPYVADVTGWAGNHWANQPESTTAYYRFFLFAVPLIAGLATGLAARHRPTRGVLNALAILTVPAIIVPGLIMGLSYARLGFDTTTPIFNWLPFPIPGICGLVPWVLMGCLGAGMGKGLRERTAKLRTRVGRQLRLKHLAH